MRVSKKQLVVHDLYNRKKTYIVILYINVKKTQEPRLHQKHSTLDPQVKVIAMGPALAGHRRRPNVITVAQNRDRVVGPTVPGQQGVAVPSSEDRRREQGPLLRRRLTWDGIDSAGVDRASQSDGSQRRGVDVSRCDASQSVGAGTLRPPTEQDTFLAVGDRVSSQDPASVRSHRRETRPSSRPN